MILYQYFAALEQQNFIFQGNFYNNGAGYLFEGNGLSIVFLISGGSLYIDEIVI